MRHRVRMTWKSKDLGFSELHYLYHLSFWHSYWLSLHMHLDFQSGSLGRGQHYKVPDPQPAYSLYRMLVPSLSSFSSLKYKLAPSNPYNLPSLRPNMPPYAYWSKKSPNSTSWSLEGFESVAILSLAQTLHLHHRVRSDYPVLAWRG